jgi:hypothetical protein
MIFLKIEETLCGELAVLAQPILMGQLAAKLISCTSFFDLDASVMIMASEFKI